MTLLAVDFGTKRLGVAVTDSAERMALPLASFAVRSEDEGVDKIARIAQERGVREIIVGLPIGHRGGETQMSAQVRAFGEKLRVRIAVPVTFSDERFTTKLAEAPMMEAGVSAKKRRGLVDAGAASLLLLAVLDARRPS
ncbi:MAG: hypothetical protein A3G34_10780 [Candidatus Lindowbacteria bacterium RIFCSPLOWO2_12_FULL_62_27]|nr:MAG: hypothetical protein A3G34_10780 [Candidatus Lindowbacteria bacterium RIFCSPLOWO2_12_FULL_62_27]